MTQKWQIVLLIFEFTENHYGCPPQCEPEIDKIDAIQPKPNTI